MNPLYLTHADTVRTGITRSFWSYMAQKPEKNKLVMGHRMKTSMYRKDNIDVKNKHRYRKKISIIVI